MTRGSPVWRAGRGIQVSKETRASVQIPASPLKGKKEKLVSLALQDPGVTKECVAPRGPKAARVTPVMMGPLAPPALWVRKETRVLKGTVIVRTDVQGAKDRREIRETRETRGGRALSGIKAHRGRRVTWGSWGSGVYLVPACLSSSRPSLWG